MADNLGNIPVPEIAPTGTFPIVPDFPYGRALAPDVAVHQFGSGNAKIEQRYLLGNGARRFLVRRAWLTDLDRIALRTFWETRQGPYGAFTYNLPNDSGVGTTPVICRFANEPLSWEMLTDHVCSVGVTLIEIPSTAPTCAVDVTAMRVPPAALQTALLSQTQQIIPLIKIQPLQAGYPVIYISDRRCTVGGQLYQARLLSFDGISQGMGGEADEASFTFGNADRVMRDLANDVDLFRASLEFSLYHVESRTKLDLWKGDIVNWSMDDGPEFRVSAADGLYELNLPYPTRKCSRTCGKLYDSTACPFSSIGAMDLVHFPSADPATCDKGYDTPNGCLAHGMKRYFGGILAEPQGVRIKDNSTGTWGFGRSPLTSVSMVADSIYDQVLPEIYTDSDMPVNCKIAAGRDESDFYSALGIVGEGPLVFGSGHKLDGQYHHGPGNLGLRTAPGDDPAGAADYFSLDESGNQTGGDWRKVYNGASTYKDNFAAGTAFLTIRRSDPKGLQLSRPAEHQMEAVVAQGLRGWMWTDSGDHQTFVRSTQVLTNPLWITVNMLLRARGVWLADAATQEQFFDVKSLADSTLVAGVPKGAALVCDLQVAKLVGAGNEAQFKFRGVMQEEKPLRDWLQEVLMNCLGFYTFSFGKLKLGVRMNSSSVEAFTEGNILFRSLQLAPIRPGFNHLTANFADDEYEFVANSITVYDKDHAAFLAGGTGPLFLKSNVNLAGTSSKSQAGRIISVRLREELGGITPEEWKRARQLSFRTTALALNVVPGMVCSMAHPAMPGGSGEFRVTSWRLNPDFSIDIQGRTTTDSMYDLLVGPKPADVEAEPVPTEVVDPMPGDVRPFAGQPFAITQTDLPSGDVALDVVYDPPDPIGSFAGIYGIITTPDGKLHYPGDHQYNGDPEAGGAARRGGCRFNLPTPGEEEPWRAAIGSLARTFRKEFVAHDAATGTPTPNRLIGVTPVPGGGELPMPLAEAVQGVTATVRYGVFTERDGTKKLKVQVSGAVTPPADNQHFLRARITITLDALTIELGYTGGDHTYVADWIEIPEGEYTVRAYSVNKENAETPDPFVSLTPLVINTMPASPFITNPLFEVEEQLIEDPATGALKHEWRIVGSWTQEISDYHWFTKVQLRPLAGGDTRPLVELLQKGGTDRDYITGWLPMGAQTTYQLEYVAVNRLEIASAPVIAGSFTVGPMGATENVLAFNAGTLDEETGAWADTMSWDPLKQFMLIDWGCLPPSSTENWSGVAVFIKVPNDAAPGGFDYVQATGVMDKSMFTPSAAGPLAFYDRIAIELKYVPNPQQNWTFIACSYDREGNPQHDANGKPTGPYISLATLTTPTKPITPDGKVNPDALNRKIALGDLDNANINIEDFAGSVHINRIANLGEFNIASFTGNLDVNRIDNLGSFTIENFTGNLPIGRITNLESINISMFQGNLDVGRVANLGTFSIGNFAGVITTQQIQDGFLADLNKFATDLRPITRVANRPALPHAAYPLDTLVLDLSEGKLYKNVANVWTAVSASDTITGKIASGDIISVNAATLNGQINAGVITHVQVSQFAGTLSATQCQSIHIASFFGNLDITRVANVNLIQISNLQGNLDASRVANIGNINIGSLGGNLDVSRVANIGTINIGTFTGTLVISQFTDGLITSAKIASLDVSKLNAGTMNVGSGGLSFSGTGGITIMNGGGIYVNPGVINCVGGYYVSGAAAGFQNVLVIDSYTDANFRNLKVYGSTRIDWQGNGYFANIYTKAEVDALIAGHSH